MTTIDTTGTLPRSRSRGSRVFAVVRLLFVNPKVVLWTPLAIMAFTFAIDYAIWLIIETALLSIMERAEVTEASNITGASPFLFVYVIVVAVQSITLTFPFAQGYGVTRRDFFLGASVTFVGLSVLFSAVWTVLAAIEALTGGWGIGARIYTAVYFGDGQWYERAWVVLAGFLFFFFVGAVMATIYVRWRSMGMYLFFGTTAVLLIAAAAVVTVTESWPSVGGWLVAAGPNGLAWWSLVVTAVSALVGYLVLRKATPRE